MWLMDLFMHRFARCRLCGYGLDAKNSASDIDYAEFGLLRLICWVFKLNPHF